MAQSSTNRQVSDSSGPPWGIIAGVAIAILVGAGLIAYFTTRGGSTKATAEAGFDQSMLEGSTDPADQTGTVSVSGEPLPEFAPGGQDPAIGMTVPEVSATDFGGRPHRFLNDGTPRLYAFMAHWCPHCQRELPILTEWIDSGEVPDALEIVAVSTSVNPGAPNYPPYSWFVSDKYPGLVVRDDDAKDFAQAFGLTGFPFLVAVDGSGKVVVRASGAQERDALAAMANAAVSGTSATVESNTDASSGTEPSPSADDESNSDTGTE